MRNFLYALVVIFLIIPSKNSHTKPLVNTLLSSENIVGSGTLTYLFWDIYRATLYAPRASWSYEKPFVLHLNYLRSLKGEKIADRSAEEIRKLGFDNELKIAAWHSTMRKLFPDVSNDTSLSGLFVPNDTTYFYYNNKYIGQIDDPEFGKWFFNIWLSEQSSAPELRKKLLGL